MVFTAMDALFLILIAMVLQPCIQAAPISDLDMMYKDYTEPDLTLDEIYDMEESSPMNSQREKALVDYKTRMQQENWKAYLPDMDTIRPIHLKSKCTAMNSFSDHLRAAGFVDDNFEMEHLFLDNRIEDEYLEYLKLADAIYNAAKKKAVKDELKNVMALTHL